MTASPIVRPRRLVHRGVVVAGALLVERTRLGEPEARRRVLAAWEPGAALHTVAHDLVLVLARPRLVDCAQAPGIPLVRLGHALSMAPLDDDELERLAPMPGALIRVRAGQAQVELPDGPADPSTWLDLGSFTLLATTPLSEIVAPELVLEPPVVVDRATFAAQIGQAPPELAAVASAMEQLRSGKPGTDRNGRIVAEPVLPRLARWLGRLFAATAAPRANLLGTGKLRAPPVAGGAGLGARLWSRLRGALVRLLYRTELGRLLGRRQAEYLQEMLALLQRGDVGEGLRRALPLGGAASPDLSPALGLPRRRESLALSLTASASSSSIVLVDEFMDQLRRVYRSTFERLEREGDIERAAFVLVELLRAHEEAVQFLERHERFRLAAELAESRELAPGLVVRQWLLARDVPRALRYAEQHDAFADAIGRLEKTHPGGANNLRLLWADRLAARGDYAGAVDVAWPVGESRALTRVWIDRALEVGGFVAARLLVRRLQLGDDLAATRARIVALLDDTAVERQPERTVFRDTLARAEPTRELAPFARAALRTQLRDVARFGTAPGAEKAQRQTRERLLRLAADSALRADLPSLPSRPPAKLAPTSRSWAAEDHGTLPIYDAVRLPSGDLLLALGELGTRLVRPDGRTIVHFELPATALVLSDHGDRALALAVRGQVARVAQLDLQARRGRAWADLVLHGAAFTFDGASWFVAEENALVCLDVESDRPTARWRVDRLETTPAFLTREARRLSFLTTAGGSVERWTYETPSMALRVRDSFGHGEPLAISANGEERVLMLPPHGDRPLTIVRRGSALRPPANATTLGRPVGCEVDREWAIVIVGAPDVMHVLAYAHGDTAPWCSLAFAGAQRLRARLQEDLLTVCDERGRLLVVHLPTGSVLTELRLHLE